MSTKETHILSNFAENLEYCRCNIGWNSSELGRRAGVSRAYISNMYIRPPSSLGVMHIFKLSQAVGHTIDDMLLPPEDFIQIHKGKRDALRGVERTLEGLKRRVKILESEAV